jgi:hypothetical protein
MLLTQARAPNQTDIQTDRRASGPEEETLEQGDQIWRISAHWVIVYFGLFLKNTKTAQTLFCVAKLF